MSSALPCALIYIRQVERVKIARIAEPRAPTLIRALMTRCGFRTPSELNGVAAAALVKERRRKRSARAEPVQSHQKMGAPRFRARLHSNRHRRYPAPSPLRHSLSFVKARDEIVRCKVPPRGKVKPAEKSSASRSAIALRDRTDNQRWNTVSIRAASTCGRPCAANWRRSHRPRAILQRIRANN